MNDFLSPITSSLSPSDMLSDREKQRRIHSWLGEQTTAYLKPSFSTRTKNGGDQTYENGFHSETSKALEAHAPHENEKNQALNSQSVFTSIVEESCCKHDKHLPKQKSLKADNKNKTSTVTFAQCSSIHNFDKRHSASAVKIQALWRGYHARSKNTRVIEIRQEIRARRTEQYIVTLCNEISILKKKQKADRKLCELQTEAIRFMWTQIRDIHRKYDAKITELQEKLDAVNVADQIISHSSYSKENVDLDDADHKEKLKNTVENLQTQVIQLQDALLSFSSRLVSENDVVAHSDESEVDEDDVTQDEVLQEKGDIVSELPMQSIAISTNDDDEMLSARDNVPKVSVQNILQSLESPLTEKELWSFCEQSLVALQGLKDIKIKFLSPLTVYVRKDGLVSFSDADIVTDNTYSAPELSQEGQAVTIKSLIFSLAVTIWTAADFNMTEDQAPCLSTDFENMLVKMSQDEASMRADIDDVLSACAEHHSSANCNSMQVCASLYAETCDIKKGKKRQIKSVSFSDLFAKEISKIRSNFQTTVVPQLNLFSIQLKPASERELLPKPTESRTPHEDLLQEVRQGITLKKQPEPKLYTVQDLFRENPELIRKLNILPGQRRKNVMAVKATIKKLSSTEGRQVIPSAPQGLKAEIKTCSSDKDINSTNLILKWYPSYVYNSHGGKNKSEAIIGYRIYVNQQPKGMVNGVKCRALLDGLKRAGEYRIHICAVSALGESEPSNTVIANLKSGLLSSYTSSLDARFSMPNNASYISDKTLTSPSPVSPSQKNHAGEPSGDVVEKVLHRYGIKKSELSYPLSPTKPSKSSRKDFKLPPNLGSCHHSKETPAHTNNERFFALETGHFGNVYSASTSSSEDHITPRTKALLEQLKHELLD